ncbi:MAG: hypothetical protein WA902_08880 [Thermosynechococcaceae cyanobacterium]
MTIQDRVIHQSNLITIAFMNKQHILNEIVRTAEANGGKPLGRQRFLKATGIKVTDWSGKYWVRWSDAVKEAGFAPNEKQQAFTDEYLLSQYAVLTRELGHIPTEPEVRMKARFSQDFPSHNTFNRLGSKQEKIARTHAFAIEREEFLDVATICELYLLESETDVEAQYDDKSIEPGYVYLIKAGRYFKIGRTNSLSRPIPSPTDEVRVGC